MGLSITYQLLAKGRSEEIRQRMVNWQSHLKELFPNCEISNPSAADEQVSFDFLPGPGTEIARMRLRRERDHQWRGFWDCKTQYAGCAEYGGTENFLKAHRGLITALDIGHSLGLVENVSDDGGYWTSRNIEKLLKQFHIYQNVVGSLVAQVRAAGFSVAIPLRSESELMQKEGRPAIIESPKFSLPSSIYASRA